MSAIVDLKHNHQRERNTTDLKSYSQLACFKKHGTEKYFLRFTEVL